jgi:hypothetical protein
MTSFPRFGLFVHKHHITLQTILAEVHFDFLRVIERFRRVSGGQAISHQLQGGACKLETKAEGRFASVVCGL